MPTFNRLPSDPKLSIKAYNLQDLACQLSEDGEVDRTTDNLHIVALREKGPLIDSAKIYSLGEKRIILLSPKEFPDTMKDYSQSMNTIRKNISTRAAKAMLPIIAAGRIGRESFLVFPRCTSLRTGLIWGRIDRANAAKKLIVWLREFSTITGEPTEESKRNFTNALTKIIEMPELSDEMRNAARAAASKIVNGELKPFHVPMHGDLWRGNVMIQEDGSLAVIDWGGSAAKGYGIFDLIRASQSFNLGLKRVRWELNWHRAHLGLGEAGPTIHLLSALGHFATKLGQFSKERFCLMANECYSTLRNVETFRI